MCSKFSIVRFNGTAPHRTTLGPYSTALHPRIIDKYHPHRTAPYKKTNGTALEEYQKQNKKTPHRNVEYGGNP